MKDQTLPTQQAATPLTPVKNMPKHKHTRRAFIGKLIVFNSINAILIVAILVLVTRMSGKANEIKTLKTQILVQENSDAQFLTAELTANKDKIDTLNDRFANETKQVSFVRDIERLKPNGVITDFPYLSESPIVDTTKNLGIPVLVEFQGDLQQVNSVLNDFESTPYLIRPVEVDLTINPERQVNLKYGGVLYVK